MESLNSFNLDPEPLGEGGFGVVYKAKDKITGDLYAIKVIDLKKNDVEDIKYIEREINILSTGCERSIVKYFGSWNKNDLFFIQMELCDDSLRSILGVKHKAFNRYGYKPLNSLEYYISCEIFFEILKCVQNLHGLKPPIIHRDLKPENILIKYNDSNGCDLKICDFGLAVVHERPSQSHSDGVGDHHYWAPEVMRGRKYNLNADVYSTGVIAKEIFDIGGQDEASIKKLDFQKQNIDKNMRTLFENLEKEIKRMINQKVDKRADSTEVLSTASEWRITANDAKQLTTFESVFENLKNFENPFFYKYLSSKFI